MWQLRDLIEWESVASAFPKPVSSHRCHFTRPAKKGTANRFFLGEFHQGRSVFLFVPSARLRKSLLAGWDMFYEVLIYGSWRTAGLCGTFR